MDATRTVAARMGHWSARHRKTAVLGWLGFVALAVLLTVLVPQRELSNAERNVGAPAQAQRILDAHGWKSPAT